MNRDAILATIIGFAIGLTITGVFLLGPNIKKMLPTTLQLPSFGQKASSNPQSQSTPAVQDVSDTTIDSPLPDAVANDETLLVSGSSPKDSTIIIQGENEDTVVSTGPDSKYTGKVTLVEGVNEIQVSTVSEDGKQVSKSITVFYTPEDF